MVLCMRVHSDNMAGINDALISESILDLKKGLSRSLKKKKRIAIRFTLFSDEKVETFVLELWQPFSFMKQDTDNDIHSNF